MPHSGQKKIKEIGQTFCCNLKSACVKAIWDLFPQNEKQVTKIHFQDMTRFKMVYYMSWLLPYLRSKTIFTLSNSFVFYWFLKCSMSHTSFSSLATCRSFCDNRSHMLLFKSKNKHIKKTFHCCRRHNLPFLSTIIPSTSPQLSTDIRALWSTDALVAHWMTTIITILPNVCKQLPSAIFRSISLRGNRTLNPALSMFFALSQNYQHFLKMI